VINYYEAGFGNPLWESEAISKALLSLLDVDVPIVRHRPRISDSMRHRFQLEDLERWVKKEGLPKVPHGCQSIQDYVEYTCVYETQANAAKMIKAAGGSEVEDEAISAFTSFQDTVKETEEESGPTGPGDFLFEEDNDNDDDDDDDDDDDYDYDETFGRFDSLEFNFLIPDFESETSDCCDSGIKGSKAANSGCSPHSCQDLKFVTHVDFIKAWSLDNPLAKRCSAISVMQGAAMNSEVHLTSKFPSEVYIQVGADDRSYEIRVSVRVKAHGPPGSTQDYEVHYGDGYSPEWFPRSFKMLMGLAYWTVLLTCDEEVTGG